MLVEDGADLRRERGVRLRKGEGNGMRLVVAPQSSLPWCKGHRMSRHAALGGMETTDHKTRSAHTRLQQVSLLRVRIARSRTASSVVAPDGGSRARSCVVSCV